MPKPKLRKPNHRQHGTQVTICGKPIQANVICQIPPGKHPIHAAMAINDDGDVYAFLLKPDGDTEAWRLAEVPE